jgi:hypothetical protein
MMTLVEVSLTQQQKKFHKFLFNEPGMVVHAYNPS